MKSKAIAKANVMVLKPENQADSQFDKLKWLLAIILLLAGLFVNHYYSQVPMLWRTAGWFVILILSAFVASQTVKGRWVVRFVRDSRAELRKVVWPTREEVTQTTLVVAVMVTILALLLWGMDSILVWLIGWLTGQRS